MGDGVRRVVAEPITAAAWAPFGWLPRPDTDPADGTDRLAFAWDDAHVNVIAHGPEEVPHVDGGLRCERLYRHDTHTQVLLVLNVPAVVAVAPAATTFAAAGDAAAVRAFSLRPLDALVLHRGTWHWGPFPLGDEPVRLFNVQGRRYAEDNAHVDLAPLGAAVDVVVGGG